MYIAQTTLYIYKANNILQFTKPTKILQYCCILFAFVCIVNKLFNVSINSVKVSFVFGLFSKLWGNLDQYLQHGKDYVTVMSFPNSPTARTTKISTECFS